MQLYETLQTMEWCLKTGKKCRRHTWTLPYVVLLRMKWPLLGISMFVCTVITWNKPIHWPQNWLFSKSNKKKNLTSPTSSRTYRFHLQDFSFAVTFRQRNHLMLANYPKSLAVQHVSNLISPFVHSIRLRLGPVPPFSEQQFSILFFIGQIKFIKNSINKRNKLFFLFVVAKKINKYTSVVHIHSTHPTAQSFASRWYRSNFFWHKITVFNVPLMLFGQEIWEENWFYFHFIKKQTKQNGIAKRKKQNKKISSRYIPVSDFLYKRRWNVVFVECFQIFQKLKIA